MATDKPVLFCGQINKSYHSLRCIPHLAGKPTHFFPHGLTYDGHCAAYGKDLPADGHANSGNYWTPPRGSGLDL